MTRGIYNEITWLHHQTLHQFFSCIGDHSSSIIVMKVIGLLLKPIINTLAMIAVIIARNSKQTK